jgi:hypothetical protein
MALLYGIGESAGSYLTEVRAASTGTLIDRDYDPYPSIIRAYRHWLLTSWGGVHYSAYQPAHVKIYDTASGVLALDVDVAPDEAIENTRHNVSASHVALSNTSLFVAIGSQTYVYSLTALLSAQKTAGAWPSPGRIEGVGAWLGVADDDRLFFENGQTLFALDVSGGHAAATPVTGVIGPFTSMVSSPADTSGYTLTSDRRIVTIDMEKAGATSSTLAPGCYSLVRVDTIDGHPVALCSTGDGGALEAIGL